LALKEPKNLVCARVHGHKLGYWLAVFGDDNGLAFGFYLVHDGETVSFECACGYSLHRRIPICYYGHHTMVTIQRRAVAHISLIARRQDIGCTLSPRRRDAGPRWPDRETPVRE